VPNERGYRKPQKCWVRCALPNLRVGRTFLGWAKERQRRAQRVGVSEAPEMLGMLRFVQPTVLVEKSGEMVKKGRES